MGPPGVATRPARSPANLLHLSVQTLSLSRFLIKGREQEKEKWLGLSSCLSNGMPEFCCITAGSSSELPTSWASGALAKILMRICPCFLQESERSRTCMFAS